MCNCNSYNDCCFCIKSYTKPKGQLPDYESPVILQEGISAVEDFCNRLHRQLINDFK